MLLEQSISMPSNMHCRYSPAKKYSEMNSLHITLLKADGHWNAIPTSRRGSMADDYIRTDCVGNVSYTSLVKQAASVHEEQAFPFCTEPTASLLRVRPLSPILDNFYILRKVTQNRAATATATFAKLITSSAQPPYIGLIMGACGLWSEQIADLKSSLHQGQHRNEQIVLHMIFSRNA